ncbi:MAG: DUF1127 domain-containing protein [Geminicoccaceae bacterium]
MKHADIAIITDHEDLLGAYRVETGFSWPARIAGKVRRWLDRRGERRALGLLDERLLKDIGVTRFDAEREIRKPFWQA